MAVRKRFSKAERELLTSALAGDRKVEVQNVTQWHAATLAPGAEVTRDAQGWESIAATIDKTRGAVRAGDSWPVAPGHVRARQAPAAAYVHPADPRRDHDVSLAVHHGEAAREMHGAGLPHDREACGIPHREVPAWHGQPYPVSPGHLRARQAELPVVWQAGGALHVVTAGLEHVTY